MDNHKPAFSALRFTPIGAYYRKFYTEVFFYKPQKVFSIGAITNETIDISFIKY